MVRLVRCRLDGRVAEVLVVTPLHDHPPASILQRLEHEYALRPQLDAAWAARQLELRHEGGRVALVLEDPGGQTLDRILGQPLPIDTFLRLAIPLTTAVAHVHAHGLIHKDLKPANILVDQYKRDIPYATIGQAFHDLVHEILGKSEAELSQWRSALSATSLQCSFETRPETSSSTWPVQHSVLSQILQLAESGREDGTGLCRQRIELLRWAVLAQLLSIVIFSGTP